MATITGEFKEYLRCPCGEMNLATRPNKCCAKCGRHENTMVPYTARVVFDASFFGRITNLHYEFTKFEYRGH